MTENEKVIEAILAWYQRKPELFNISESAITKNTNWRSNYIQLQVDTSRKVIKKGGWFSRDTTEIVKTESIRVMLNKKGQRFSIFENDPQKVKEIKERIKKMYHERREYILEEVINATDIDDSKTE